MRLSEKAAKELHEALLRIVRAQRECAWCGKVLGTPDELVDHIIAAHETPESFRFRDGTY